MCSAAHAENSTTPQLAAKAEGQTGQTKPTAGFRTIGGDFPASCLPHSTWWQFGSQKLFFFLSKGSFPPQLLLLGLGLAGAEEVGSWATSLSADGERETGRAASSSLLVLASLPQCLSVVAGR